ncbi:hypothetical protein RFI_30887 [Reticulomyxa filosa]|uniref:Uncharacterized protein n=1 Tax=Reticulomyxa filosa TaxID=46433 RepID=X6M0K3_RETFI|nr:hypothetical protein RFI_30887 [Reticulomyxa filosa]|eukprot:ETO06505.1 hypothetical protein RFI_30887 [Reticulomyxa filosa]
MFRLHCNQLCASQNLSSERKKTNTKKASSKKQCCCVHQRRYFSSKSSDNKQSDDDTTDVHLVVNPTSQMVLAQSRNRYYYISILIFILSFIFFFRSFMSRKFLEISYPQKKKFLFFFFFNKNKNNRKSTSTFKKHEHVSGAILGRSFASTLQITHDGLKMTLLDMYRKHLEQQKMKDDKASVNGASACKEDWMGLFLYSPLPKEKEKEKEKDQDQDVVLEAQSHDEDGHDHDRVEGGWNDEMANAHEDIEAELRLQEDGFPLSFYENNLDELNIDLVHRVVKPTTDPQEVHKIGTLVKIDWDDPNSNIQAFVEMEEREKAARQASQSKKTTIVDTASSPADSSDSVKETVGKQTKQSKPKSLWHVESLSTPMFLRVIGARRIGLYGVAQVL